MLTMPFLEELVTSVLTVISIDYLKRYKYLGANNNQVGIQPMP